MFVSGQEFHVLIHLLLPGFLEGQSSMGAAAEFVEADSPTADGILGGGVFHAGCEACGAGIAVFIGLCKSGFFVGTGARAAAAVKNSWRLKDVRRLPSKSTTGPGGFHSLQSSRIHE